VKIKLFVLVSAVFINLFGATYYLSVNGSDSNSGGSGSPWKSIERLNQAALLAGDSILFNKGDTFPGGVIIKTSGLVNEPIYYGSYGSGAKPVISGALKIGPWTSRGNGLFAAPLLMRPEMLSYDGKPLTLARSPNKGYYTITSIVDSLTRFTDSSAKSSINWTGAIAHIRTSNFTVTAKNVTAYDGVSKTFTVATIPGFAAGYKFTKGWGYFLNGHIGALDTAGEWYYDSSAHEILIYSPYGSNPAVHAVSGSVLTHGFYSQRGSLYNYIEIDGLELSQFARAGVEIAGGNIKVRNCLLKFNEQKGIEIYSGSSNQVAGNIIYGTNGLGLNISGDNSIIERNTISAIALFDRLNGYGIQLGYGIRSKGAGNIIRLNRIDSVGYIGIHFEGIKHLVEKNYIRNVCLTTDDGGATYCANRNFPANQGVVGSIIRDNIVMLSKGNGDGASKTDHRPANGIYLDDFTHDVTVIGNTVAYCSGWGYQLHNSVDCRIVNNLSHGCDGAQIFLQQDAVMYADSMRNNTISNNIFSSTADEQRTLYITKNRSHLTLARLDSNIYWNPFADALIHAPGGPYTLADWKAISGQDNASRENVIRWNGFKITDTISSELISNGNLDVNSSAWRIWSSGGTSTIIRDTGKGFETGSLLVNCAGQTAIVSTNVLALVKDQQYLVRFSVRGIKSSTLLTCVRLNGSPYSIVGHSKAVVLDNSRRDYAFVFKATETNTSCRLDFQNSLIDSIYWIDNASIRAVNAIAPNPSEEMRLFVNPTERDSTIRLTADLFHLDGVRAPQSVTIRPFGSALFYRDSVAGSTMAENYPADNVLRAEISPNPFNPVVNIKVYGARNILKGDVFNARGRKVSGLQKDKGRDSGILLWNAISFPSGLYVFKIYADGKIIVRKAMLIK